MAVPRGITKLFLKSQTNKGMAEKYLLGNSVGGVICFYDQQANALYDL